MNNPVGSQDVDVFSVVAGVIFVALGGWFAFESQGWGRLDLALALPVLLVLAGAAVLVAAASRMTTGRR